MKKLNKATINDIRDKRTDLVELIHELDNENALPYRTGYLPGSILSDMVYDDFEELVLDNVEIPEPDVEYIVAENIADKFKDKHWLRTFLVENKHDLYQLFYVLDELNYKKEDYGIWKEKL